MADQEQLGFSPEALKERYRIEREKRLRSDGNAQFHDLSGEFAHFDVDPYAEPGFTLDPIVREVDTLIVGAGFGGMFAGARLHQAGIDDYLIVEKAGDFGGTWYWNRYPGAACDVEDYIYMPMLEELGVMPTERYAKGPEIFAHCQRIGHHFDLYSHALFQTRITSAVWNEADKRWIVETDRKDRIAARFLIIAGGMLHKAKLPNLPGLNSFKGHSFHTGRWDYEYTGGTPLTELDKLGDKRVAVIGTGATSIQVVPPVGRSAKHLYVFQRTPSSVSPRDNRKTDPEWWNALKPGWQAERIANFGAIVRGVQTEEDLIKDGWTWAYADEAQDYANDPVGAFERRQIADYSKMEAVRNRCDDVVEDKATAEALKPWYNLHCKRPCFHDEYLQTFNKPNVTLVDTGGKGVERITPNGVVVDGKEYEVDCIIFASGYELTTEYTGRMGFNPVGRDGVSLKDAWSEGAATLMGLHARGFPNMMMYSTVQGGFSVNVPQVLIEQSAHTAYVIKHALDEGIEVVEPTEEAQNDWLNVILSHVMARATIMAECTPGAYNNEGAADIKMAKNAAFMGGTPAFIDILKDWRKKGDLAGLEMHKGKASAEA